MSITKISKLGPGCFYVISALMIFGIAGSFLLNQHGPNSSGNHMEGPDPRDTSLVVAQLDDYPITVNLIDKAANRNALGVALSPMDQARNLGGVLSHFVDDAYKFKVMRDVGLKLSDSDVAGALETEMRDQFMQMKMRLIIGKQIDQAATDDQVKEALKKQGIDFDDVRNKSFEELRTNLKDPVQRPEIEVEAGKKLLDDKLAQTIQVSDDELKKDFDEVILKRILIETGGSLPVRVRADEALKALNGGMTFDAAIDKFSQSPPEKGKKLSELSTTSLRKDLATEVRPAIEKLKPGQHSDIVVGPDGMSIYELVSVSPKVPKDFDKTKEAARKAYRESRVGDLLKSKLDALKKGNSLVWKEPVYEALHKLTLLVDDDSHTPDEAKDTAGLRAIAQACTDPKSSEEAVIRAAAFCRYRAFTLILQKAKPDEKKKMADERIAVLKGVLEFSDDTEERINLAELCADKKDAAGAAESLLTAAHRNLNELSNPERAHMNEVRIDALEGRMVNEKLLTDDQKQELDQAHKDWYEAFNEQQARQKKEEEDKRKAEEEDRKAKLTPKPQATPPTVKPQGPGLPGPSPSAKPSAPPKHK